jgi:glutathione S-transferase
MFTLYSRPGSGSAAVEALFAELDMAFQLEDIPRGADGQVPVAYRHINPRGEIPTLRLADNSLMTESAAMMIYLADLHPEKGLAPALDSQLRATYLRWMLYFASTVYASDLRYFYPARYTANHEHAPDVKKQALETLAADYQIFADFLGQQDFILGEIISAADIYAALLVSWMPDLDALFAKNPNLKAYYLRVAARPKILAVFKRNGMPLV